MLRPMIRRILQIRRTCSKNPKAETKFKNLLLKYEEVEELTCAICFDKMRVGQTIIKTFCGGSNELKHKSDVSHYFQEKQSELVSDIRDQDEMYLQSNLLKGHKFHKGCF